MYNTYFISGGKIRIIRVRKTGLKYVKIRFTQFIIYKHSLTNKYRKLVNVTSLSAVIWQSKPWTVEIWLE